MRRAKFIVFEGIDGSGKGTQLELVSAALRAQGKKVGLLDFPRYGNPSAFFVEKYLNGGYGTLEEVGPKLASMFYALDRFDAKKEAEQALAENDYVIANRYVSSNMIFQASKLEESEQGPFLDWLEDLEHGFFGIPRPDHVVLLDITVETSARLVAEKQKRDYIKGGETKDIHEKATWFLTKTRETALRIAKKYAYWTVLECEKDGELLSREAVTEKILSAIR
jgi:dTMP kinase